MTSSEGGHVDVVVAMFFLTYIIFVGMYQKSVSYLKAHILKRILYSGFI